MGRSLSKKISKLMQLGAAPRGASKRAMLGKVHPVEAADVNADVGKGEAAQAPASKALGPSKWGKLSKAGGGE